VVKRRKVKSVAVKPDVIPARETARKAPQTSAANKPHINPNLCVDVFDGVKRSTMATDMT
jgi:hypothetical protein